MPGEYQDTIVSAFEHRKPFQGLFRENLVSTFPAERRDAGPSWIILIKAQRYDYRTGED
jgi:hypothetical protein